MNLRQKSSTRLEEKERCRGGSYVPSRGEGSEMEPPIGRALPREKPQEKKRENPQCRKGRPSSKREKRARKHRKVWRDHNSALEDIFIFFVSFFFERMSPARWGHPDGCPPALRRLLISSPLAKFCKLCEAICCCSTHYEVEGIENTQLSLPNG